MNTHNIFVLNAQIYKSFDKMLKTTNRLSNAEIPKAYDFS